jgi:hypothetical protein
VNSGVAARWAANEFGGGITGAGGSAATTRAVSGGMAGDAWSKGTRGECAEEPAGCEWCAAVQLEAAGVDAFFCCSAGERVTAAGEGRAAAVSVGWTDRAV